MPLDVNANSSRKPLLSEIALTANPKPVLIKSMKIRFLLTSCLALLSFATIVFPVSAADTKNPLEQALRDLDAQWSAAAAARDLDKLSRTTQATPSLCLQTPRARRPRKRFGAYGKKSWRVLARP